MKNKIDQVLGTFLAVIMGIMVLNVLWQVFTRYVIGVPSSFTDELARYLMIWLGLLGAAYVSGKNMHIAIDVLVKKTKAETQIRLKKAVNLIILLFAFFTLVVGGFRLVYIAFHLEQNSPSLQIPLGVVYLVLPISGLLIIYYKSVAIKLN